MLIQYIVRTGEEAAVKTAVERFVAAIAEHEPETRYESWLKEDGRSFAHLMTFADAAAQERHKGADYTKEFVAVLYPACEEEPTYEPVTLVASARE